MSKTLLTLFIIPIAMFIVLSPADVFAAVDLPWSTTYDCNEWTQSDNPYGGDINCDGLSKGEAWTCSGGEEERITSAANNPNGGGGRGQRHWEGDGSDQNSGGLKIPFNPTPEVWFRWYMRYELGFAWKNLHYDKWLYFNLGGSPSCIIGFRQSDKLAVNTYKSANGTGWNTIMGGSTSDGQWHCYEVHLKMDGSNDVGEIWIDGVRKLHHTNINFGTGSWSSCLIGSNQSNPANGRCMAVDFDDIKIVGPGDPSLKDDGNGNLFIGPIVASLQGDITGDSLIDIQDTQACANHILGTQDWSGTADMNGDSSVNVLDVQGIVNIILGG